MAIRLLDSNTIDKIAAGEVVERPASIVKELCENAIDAGCDGLTIEIKEGGISFIRITDNGCGIPKEDIATAFLRHATSKISTVDDIAHIYSLGFRGEALSSICAVSKVEMISKTKDDLTGCRYAIEGGVEIERSEVGVPTGTTVIVRNLFYNVPARRKFLKSKTSEMAAITDIVEHLALSHPYIAFKYITDNKEKFHTSGNGNLKDIIYRIYGREIAGEVKQIEVTEGDYSLSGYIGTPFVGRGTRSYETTFVNGRFVISDIIMKASEEAYKLYLMQHKYPFFVLNINLPADEIDINIHPAKREIKFLDGDRVYEFIYSSIRDVLTKREMLKNVALVQETEVPTPKEIVLEPFEDRSVEDIYPSKITDTFISDFVNEQFTENKPLVESYQQLESTFVSKIEETASGEQLDLFEERILSKENQKEYELIGQVFDTYWMFKFRDELLIMDQHAAHEKIRYERLVKHFLTKTTESQMLLPAIVLSLSGAEMTCFVKYKEYFANLGFEIEEFGETDISIRAVPLDLYDLNARELFLSILDELCESPIKGSPEAVHMKLASIACKGAVKGNTHMTYAQADALIGELLTLDNPYHCPHGRPTVIVISKQELEKKFSRIV